MVGYELPEAMRAFSGEINDLDSHEAIPPGLWTEVFGSEAKVMMDAVVDTAASGSGLAYFPDLKEEVTPIDRNSVFRVKMENAPGAFELDKRLKVLDFVGINRQIVFPGGLALNAQGLYADADKLNIFRTITTDRKGYARRLIDLYNDWCVRSWNQQDRLCMVGVLVGDTVDELCTSLKSMVDRGIRVFQLNSSVPPAGLSPAHPELDRLWGLAAAAGANLMLHLDAGVVTNFVKTDQWMRAPSFEGWMVGEELSLDPWTLTNLHLSTSNFIATMVLGGVFDRHPKLHIGSQEFGAGWVGPLAEAMDRYYAFTPFPSTLRDLKLKQKPSDYVRQHVRVAPFFFEPVGTYISRYGLEDVFAFASDLPHFEGGKQPYEDLAKSLEGHSETVLRKFFVENAKAILPF